MLESYFKVSTYFHSHFLKILFILSFIFLTVPIKEENGFHLDVEDYLSGLLQLASELVGNLLTLHPWISFNSFWFTSAV